MGAEMERELFVQDAKARERLESLVDKLDNIELGMAEEWLANLILYRLHPNDNPLRVHRHSHV